MQPKKNKPICNQPTRGEVFSYFDKLILEGKVYAYDFHHAAAAKFGISKSLAARYAKVWRDSLDAALANLENNYDVIPRRSKADDISLAPHLDSRK